MNRKLALALTAALLATAAWQVPAAPATAESTDDAAAIATIKERLAEFGEVRDVARIPGKDIYRVRIQGEYYYITGDGRYLLSGELYDLRDRRNLTDAAMADYRRDLIEEIDTEEVIVFAPKGKTVGAVWVFTDIDCPYCRRLHQQIDAYNRLGIEVRYLAYPRAGPGSDSWRKAEAVWCSADRGAALTRAKAGEKVAAGTDCDADIVRRHYDTGRAVGLRGTPMIVAADGRRLGGYLTPKQLLASLKKTPTGDPLH